MLNQPRAIMAIFQTRDILFIAFCCLCQASDHVPCRSAFNCIPKIHELLNLPQLRLVVNDDLELLPKRPPVQDVAVKSWNLNSWEVDSIHYRHVEDVWRRLFIRLLRETRNGYTQVEQVSLDIGGPSYATFVIIEG